MPKLKQPTSLEAIAMKVLVEFSVRYCDQLSTEGTLQMLREGISVIKENLCNRIPWCSLPEFCTTFLEKFSKKSGRKPHLQAASEILLDLEFVGLRCNDEMMRNLNPRHVHRLLGLVELDLFFVENLAAVLGNLRLNDITTLDLRTQTCDHDLTVIGRNCSKLRVMKLKCLHKITDEGLCALNPCSDLRVVDISGCYEITDIGVNLMISAHDKLEELHRGERFGIYGTSRESDGCRFLFSLNRPYPVMKRFNVATGDLTNANLRSVVSMFPNLTHFGVACESIGDLSILKSMSRLEVISIKFNNDSPDIDRAWQSLKELLTFVGGNIKALSFCRWGFSGIIHVTEQTGLDFVFSNCPNIEYLEFDYGDFDLVVPPFKKLKTLKLTTSSDNVAHPYAIKLSNIPDMLNLEVLAIEHFRVCFQTVEAIVLDHVKFPKLIRLESCGVRERKEIEAIARTNNLDFEIW